MDLKQRLIALVALAAASGPCSHACAASLRDFSHIVVIYEENHSFDNLYGLWDAVGGEPVDGVPLETSDRRYAPQLRADGVTPYDCLPQNDVNLERARLRIAALRDASGDQPPPFCVFPNAPFKIDDFIKPQDATCPKPYGDSVTSKDGPGKLGYAKTAGLPGGCTRDLVHSFYNEQYQINGGRQNRYVTGSDAAGLVMGYYDTKELPIYKFLHGDGAPKYVIADRFFQAAFGASFLNHQWLIAARTPEHENPTRSSAKDDLHSVVDANGLSARPAKEVYDAPQGALRERALTAYCEGDSRIPSGMTPAPKGVVCGDFAVGSIQPAAWPFDASKTDLRLPPLRHATIGDRLSDGHVDWAWYAGGWDNADGKRNGLGWTNGDGPNCADPNALERTIDGVLRCPDKLFQYHHQPFDYFANFGPGTPGRSDHLRDEKEFLEAAKAGALPAVSFVKPLGPENEHPGYASEANGETHLIALVKAVLDGKNGEDTLIIVTYDEFGGAWDHVPPPPYGQNAGGAHDAFGPGTRVPALVIAKKLERSGVDHALHDTTSITRLIEERFCLAPLAERDRTVGSLKSALGDRSADCRETPER